jgi:hypothetical protein
MKKSARVTLTMVAVVGLAACGRHRQDPCESATFDEQVCQQAVQDGGYHWNGSWYPMVYHFPYPYYYDSYRRYTSSGRAVVAAPPGAYGRPTAVAPGAHPSPGVVRGGFGATGAGHSAGA